MKTADAIRHFGTQTKLANALGISQPAIVAWGTTVPRFRQLQIEKLTQGALKASATVFDKQKRDPA